MVPSSRFRCALPGVGPLVVLLAASLVGCSRQPPPRQYRLTGQILAVKPEANEITIRHDDIKGFMPAMTMPFRVKDKAQMQGRLPGDLVRATLMVTDEEAWLADLEKTGWAPFPEAPAEPAAVALLKAGDPIPDPTLVDERGRAFRLSSLRGAAVLLTFIYTRCPLPDYCPRMDRHFQSVQRAIKEGRFAGRVRLVSLSFDPDYDTPAVLLQHAQAVGADPAVWTFATAPRPQIDAFAAPLGLSVMRDPGDPNSLTHNLRTAVIDRQGRLVTVLNGNEWTPDQAIAALASVPAS